MDGALAVLRQKRGEMRFVISDPPGLEGSERVKRQTAGNRGTQSHGGYGGPDPTR